MNQLTSNLHLDLFDIKRRKLEIQCEKAKLELEDHELDRRQNTLERKIRDTFTFTLTSTASLENRDSTNSWNKLGSPVHASACGTEDTINNEDCKQEKNDEPAIQQDPMVIVLSDNDLDEDDEDEAVVDHNRKRKRKNPAASDSMSEVTKQSNCLSRAGSALQDTEYQGDNVPAPANATASEELTKIVKLKVRFVTREDGQIKSLTCVKENAPATERPNSPDTNHSYDNADRAEQSRLSTQLQAITNKKGSLRRMSKRIRGYMPTPSPSASSPIQSIEPNTTITQNFSISPFRSPSPSTPLYSCECHRRNCRECYGTPAVIAEGRARSPPNSPRRQAAAVAQRLFLRGTSSSSMTDDEEEEEEEEERAELED